MFLSCMIFNTVNISRQNSLSVTIKITVVGVHLCQLVELTYHTWNTLIAAELASDDQRRPR